MTGTLTVHYSGGANLKFANPGELAKWFEERERQQRDLVRRTKARKEQIRREGIAEAYAEIAAMLKITTVN